MSKQIVIVAVLFLTGLLAVLQIPTLLINPGELTVGHAKIESDCFQCHAPFTGPSDEKCIVCHEPMKIGAGTPGKVPFHQQLKENACSNCHTDHLGREASRATRGFDHSLLSKSSRGTCRQCHAQLKDTLHRNISGECSACHSDQYWKPATFDHDSFFRFDRHHPADCTSCHPDQKYDRYTCYECHEHSPTKIRDEHLEEGIRNFMNCSACHRSGDEDEAERIWKDLRLRGISHDSVGSIPWSVDGQGLNFQHQYRDHRDDHDEHEDDD